MTFRTDATAPEIRAAGARLLESYGAYRVASGPATSIGELALRGRHAEALHQASVLELINGPVDLGTLASRRPAWTIDSSGHAIGVVHFHAPIKAEWGPVLEGRGATVLRYLPQDALVVRGSPADLEALSSLPFVDWVGSFDPSWKMPPRMPTAGSVDVRIVGFPGDAPEAIEAWLGHHGILGGNDGIRGSFGQGDFRWVRAEVPAALLRALADLPAVEFIDIVEPVHRLNAQTDWVIQTNRTFANGTGDYRYWQYGLDARGQVIGMADTGLDHDGASFRHSAAAITLGDIYNKTDMARRKVVRYVNMGVLTGQLTWPGGGGAWDPWSIKDCDHGHGTGVASTLAGNDNGLGSSPNDGDALQGRIYLEDVGGFQGIAICPNEGLIYLPEDYGELFGPPGLVYNDPVAPVRVHSDSWGADTNVYDVQARMVDAFVWAHPDMTILFAAGNAGSGSGTVGTPGTAKDIVTVGGAYNPDSVIAGAQNDLAALSSRGPTIDGRIKPTILTIFDGDSAMSDGDPLSGTGLPDQHWEGTSYATPTASAAAAIVRQYFVDGWYPAARPVPANAMNPSAALVRAILIASGAQVTGSGTVSRSASDTWPNNEQGFGRVLLANVLPIAAAGDSFRTQVVDGTAGLLTGDEAAYTFHVGVPGRVKFVLAWNDYPGTLGAAKALVNDLDLLVVAPDGTVYRGNNFGPFAQGQSLPGGTFDTTNVEEAVILKSAMAGDWSVRIIGSNIPVGPQPFALVASGSLDPSYGRVTLDRLAYSERDTIQITVDDPGATSAIVHVTSGIEPTGENVSLTRGGPDELWRGTISTAFGTPAPAPDGILQVREGDTITATYVDAAPPHTSTALAYVLASGPTIHDVRATDIGTFSANLRWSTNEPASGEVVYGTSPASLNLSASVPDLRRDHAIALSALSPDTVYYFAVASRSRLGNLTTDSNGGLPYAFRTTPLGDVLLVIGGDSFPPEREASYAAALNDNGWTWSLWRVAELGLPPLALLQARRAVIWQVGLEQYPPFNASARSLVKAYLDGGGRLLVSSHDSAWALASSDSSFATPESVAWVEGVLKATFDCDPLSIGQVKGVGSDPISGAYVGGVSYTPHRQGGADDQLSLSPSGGTATTVWTDGQVTSPPSPATQCAQNRPDGLRWVSSASNRTAGVGAWVGTPSRLVYFAFELTSLDSTPTGLNLGSTTRAAILDAALRWLVSASASTTDRDHPDVTITSPNGGVVSGSSVAIAWTATAYGTGVGIAGFTLESSSDGGQTWSTIATPLASDRSLAWDIGTVPNGDQYLVRIRADDNGTPSLSAADVSDGTFAIERPGGDAEGPVLWAGSVRVDPRPPGSGFLTTFTATADDRARGGSSIAAAEFFLQIPSPNPADSGTGTPMVDSDGAFDTTVENVAWQDTLLASPGGTCLWVNAQDASGNWGPFMSTCFAVIVAADLAPTVSIQSPTDGQTFAAASMITFTWTMSDDLVRASQLPVWANVTFNNVTIPILAGATGATSVTWTPPDLAVNHAGFHLDVVDPSGLRGSADRIFSFTGPTTTPPPPPSSYAILIAALIVLVLVAFLIFGLVLARRKEKQPPFVPIPPPAPIGPASMAATTKVCPRCRTIVNAVDVTCFFCGYAFPEGPGGRT